MPSLLALPGPSASHRAWGDVTVDPSRYGHTRVRVRILPPTITAPQQRIWQALHLWPTVGLVLGVACAVLASLLVSAPFAVGLGVFVWLGPLLMLWWTAQPTIAATVERWYILRADETPDAACERALQLVDALDRTWRSPADDASRRAWRHAYLALAAEHAPVPGHPRPARS